MGSNTEKAPPRNLLCDQKSDADDSVPEKPAGYSDDQDQPAAAALSKLAYLAQTYCTEVTEAEPEQENALVSRLVNFRQQKQAAGDFIGFEPKQQQMYLQQDADDMDEYQALAMKEAVLEGFENSVEEDSEEERIVQALIK